MQVRDSRHTQVVTSLIVASGFYSRLRGLIGRAGLAAGEGLLLTPCRAVHTFGMRFPIDLLFIDHQGQVVAVIKNLKPNRYSGYFGAASAVLELAAGEADRYVIAVGDRLSVG